MYSKKITTLFLLSIFTLPTFAAEFITIGTGSVTGTYYPTGGAVCRLVNKYRKETKLDAQLNQLEVRFIISIQLEMVNLILVLLNLILYIKQQMELKNLKVIL